MIAQLLLTTDQLQHKHKDDDKDSSAATRGDWWQGNVY